MPVTVTLPSHEPDRFVAGVVAAPQDKANGKRIAKACFLFMHTSKQICLAKTIGLAALPTPYRRYQTRLEKNKRFNPGEREPDPVIEARC